MKRIVSMVVAACMLLSGNSCIIASALANADGEPLAGKTLSPQIAEDAAKPDCWYTYDAEKAPGFCLTTKHDIVWEDEKVNVGYWKGYSPSQPDRLVMEGRGNVFIVYAGYVWDGNSIGHTDYQHLMPSLRHDALYHAIKEGVEIDRAEIDAAYKADCEKYGAELDTLTYGAIRMFGGSFNDAGAHGTLIVKKPAPKKSTNPTKKKKK